MAKAKIVTTSGSTLTAAEVSPVAVVGRPAVKDIADFPAQEVLDFLGEARVTRLRLLSNGLFEEHLQAACKRQESLGMVVLILLQKCGVQATPQELQRLFDAAAVKPELKEEAAVVGDR